MSSTLRAIEAARANVVGSSAVDARRGVIALYRAWMREAPDVVTKYELNMTTQDVRAKIREEFRKNLHVTDPRVVSLLVAKGFQELEETTRIWKQQPHVMRYFEKDQPREVQQRDFMSRFLAGHD